MSWNTVRMLLILSIILNLSSGQVDYTSIFVQSTIDMLVYISMPQGWQCLNDMGLPIEFKEGHIFKLNHSFYGLKQSPHNLCRLKQSQHDLCLFISNKIICLVYVDDCLLFAPNSKDIQVMMDKMRAKELAFNIENDAAGFLGIKTNCHDECIELTQPGHIECIIITLGLQDADHVHVPAPKSSLGQDKGGTPFEG
eukprot:15356939-Ditylum_brightwellii.AAC.1